jgi:hypothetical protein
LIEKISGGELTAEEMGLSGFSPFRAKQTGKRKNRSGNIMAEANRSCP